MGGGGSAFESTSELGSRNKMQALNGGTFEDRPSGIGKGIGGQKSRLGQMGQNIMGSAAEAYATPQINRNNNPKL